MTSSAFGSPSSMAWFWMSAATPANLKAMYRTPDFGIGYRQALILSLRRTARLQSLYSSQSEPSKMGALVKDLLSPTPAGSDSPRQVTKAGEDKREGPGGGIELCRLGGGAGIWGGGARSVFSVALAVTDVTGRTDRGTRQTCKRGQEQDEDGARLDWDWNRRYLVSRNTRQDRSTSKGRNV